MELQAEEASLSSILPSLNPRKACPTASSVIIVSNWWGKSFSIYIVNLLLGSWLLLPITPWKNTSLFVTTSVLREQRTINSFDAELEAKSKKIQYLDGGMYKAVQSIASELLGSDKRIGNVQFFNGQNKDCSELLMT